MVESGDCSVVAARLAAPSTGGTPACVRGLPAMRLLLSGWTVVTRSFARHSGPTQEVGQRARGGRVMRTVPNCAGRVVVSVCFA